MRTHEAGALHGQAGDRGPAWLSKPTDVNTLVDHLWSANVAKTDSLSVAGVRIDDLAHEHGTPLYIVDEDDFRSRAAAFRDAFAGSDVLYAAKAFLSVSVARWIAEEGLHLDVCTGGELAVALRAGFPAGRIGMHGNNKSIAELERAIEAGVGRIIVDSFAEISRLERIAAEHDSQPHVMVRVTPGVEAHTHEYISTSHQDQKFGFSITDGSAMLAAGEILESQHLELIGLHSHIGSQIFVTDGFEVATRRVLQLHARINHTHGVELRELNLGGGFGIAYTTQDDPTPPHELAQSMNAILASECAALDIRIPHLAVEPGRAIAGPSTCTLYEVGTVKEVALGGGVSRSYVAVDGGMSDNLRPALYSADYSCTLASRRSPAEPVLSRVVGKHCESGDIVVKDEFLPDDVTPGDLLAVPGTGAYCRSLANTYNHVPRAAVIAVKDGRSRTLLRRETEEDLFALDMG